MTCATLERTYVVLFHQTEEAWRIQHNKRKPLPTRPPRRKCFLALPRRRVSANAMSPPCLTQWRSTSEVAQQPWAQDLYDSWRFRSSCSTSPPPERQRPTRSPATDHVQRPSRPATSSDPTAEAQGHGVVVNLNWHAWRSMCVATAWTIDPTVPLGGSASRQCSRWFSIQSETPPGTFSSALRQPPQIIGWCRPLPTLVTIISHQQLPSSQESSHDGRTLDSSSLPGVTGDLQREFNDRRVLERLSRKEHFAESPKSMNWAGSPRMSLPCCSGSDAHQRRDRHERPARHADRGENDRAAANFRRQRGRRPIGNRRDRRGGSLENLDVAARRKVLVQQPRVAILRVWCLNHLIHPGHNLRLLHLNIPCRPSIF